MCQKGYLEVLESTNRIWKIYDDVKYLARTTEEVMKSALKSEKTHTASHKEFCACESQTEIRRLASSFLLRRLRDMSNHGIYKVKEGIPLVAPLANGHTIHGTIFWIIHPRRFANIGSAHEPAQVCSTCASMYSYPTLAISVS